jgi:hypothetical protein
MHVWDGITPVEEIVQTLGDAALGWRCIDAGWCE